MEENPLTGSVPSELGLLESLVVMELQHTQFAGSMPDEVCSLAGRLGFDMMLFGDCEEGRFQCQCCDRCY